MIFGLYMNDYMHCGYFVGFGNKLNGFVK
jgi:hypothetical protein